jgi:hypothetical protein
MVSFRLTATNPLQATLDALAIVAAANTGVASNAPELKHQAA